MSAPLFDTLRLSRNLRDKGHFSSEQAEALAEALGEASQDNLATKTDIADLRSGLKTDIADLRGELKTEIADLRGELKTDIADLRSELKTDIAGLTTDLHRVEALIGTSVAEAKTDILKWVIGAIGFQTIVILGAIISLIKVLAK